MKQVIKKYFNKEALTEQDVVNFIAEYFVKNNIVLPGDVSAQLLIMIKQGVLPLETIMNNSLKYFPELQLDTLFDKNQQMIYRKIYEINLEKIN